MMYNYLELLRDIALLCENGIETGVVGFSELGRPIPYVFLGRRDRGTVLVQAAIHAREYATCAVAVMQIKDIIRRGDADMCGSGVYVIPMINPDGAMLCRYGIDSVEASAARRVLSLNDGCHDFSDFKANARGVDLNTNFDARWGTGAQNVRERGAANYIGEYPHSAAEVRALVSFTLKVKPKATMSYHARGREIYFEFFQSGEQLRRDAAIAQRLADSAGYEIKQSALSAGGYKDYCVSRLNIPSFTVEMFDESLSYPIGSENIQKEFLRTRYLIDILRSSV